MWQIYTTISVIIITAILWVVILHIVLLWIYYIFFTYGRVVGRTIYRDKDTRKATACFIQISSEFLQIEIVKTVSVSPTEYGLINLGDYFNIRTREVDKAYE